ncbi:hypothetical protein [Actinocrispum wychmicini]|uniref:Uncharacterized protein n=1 Tax=Actinocrispum wychmicini TaxID=1213861 RepID=A0A4R2J6T2_9PSEU|nr:hypothetical protein [Actinocrispum wychmicini]TCO54761.1 hypothetical protein EV192_10849 [Actinocrispum wychmicini]
MLAQTALDSPYPEDRRQVVADLIDIRAGATCVFGDFAGINRS